MTLSKRYDPRTAEPRLQAYWEEAGTNHFDREGVGPVYSIDTPPPTVSGFLHLGHIYSYSQTDLIARFKRMRGCRVYYPMGFDDNGLPTERLVERRLGITAAAVGRQAFIEKCLETSTEMEADYQSLWQRLGLSIDWRYAYRTIDEHSRRISQRSFVDLYHKGLVYRRRAPTIWCPECHTALAQADLDDLEKEATFYTLAFRRPDGGILPIATTRPELLPACVAVFVHPSDPRYRELVGGKVTVPFFEQQVPVLADPGADPEKGTGAVMVCTFGDATDVEWWYKHNLPLVESIDRFGRLTAVAGDLAGRPVAEARCGIVQKLEERGLLLGSQPLAHSVRVHERCDTPVEYIVTQQWFIRVLDHKEELLAAGDQVKWCPPSMAARYRQWVENLNWDWCISRQRYYGVPFPVWYCPECGETLVADEDQLPVDPQVDRPKRACGCGSTRLIPEEDVLDTWATSSMTPQIAGRWLADPGLYAQLFPMSLRPQAHEIIRTWAFYTMVKTVYHFDTLPWKDVAISGWGLAPEGTGKISKSRGGGPMAPREMIERHSADGARYWAASTSLGKDSIISEDKIQLGAKLVTKLWNVARFSEAFLTGYTPPGEIPALSPADRWILSRTQRLIRRVTELWEGYDHAAAKSETEAFFWTDLADNYLEMAKLRLYGKEVLAREGARYTLYHVLLAVIKLFAPILPHVTEEIYQGLFAAAEGSGSIHRSSWPEVNVVLEDKASEEIGAALVEVATAVRRYKSEHNLPLNTELARLQLEVPDAGLAGELGAAAADLMSITRAARVEICNRLEEGLERVEADGTIQVALAR